MRIHDQGWQLRTGGGLAQLVVAEIPFFQVNHVEPLGAEDPIEALLQLWQCDP